MKKRLGINTATGIVNIILGICALGAFLVIAELIGNMEYLEYGLDIEDLISEGQLLFYGFAWISSIASIVMSIISIVQSKKYGISMVGPILALCGASGTLILCCGLSIITGPLTIAGGIVGLIQINVTQRRVNSTNRQEPGQVPLSEQRINSESQTKPVQAVNLGQQIEPINQVDLSKEETVILEEEIISSEKSSDVTSSIGLEEEWKL